MLQYRINLILKFLAIYRAATTSSARGIAGLQHEVWYHSVEDDVVVVAALGKGREVLAGLHSRQDII